MSVHEDHQNLDIVEEIYIHNACIKICFIGHSLMLHHIVNYSNKELNHL